MGVFEYSEELRPELDSALFINVEVLEGGEVKVHCYRAKVFLMTKINGRSKKEAVRQLDESLQRLKTDCIDLVQHHEVRRY
jgi:aryl-alcohol dehydrogenase-like predicted oxidoreductase